MLIAKVIRLFHTVRYLKFKQIYWRFIYMMPQFIVADKTCPCVCNFSFESISKVDLTSDYDSFIFLNEMHQISKIGWDSNSISKLWRYNLHYFDYLRQKVNDSVDLEFQKKIICNWIAENPFGKGTAWEPYPTSLRIVNWIKWHWKTNGLSVDAQLSLWNQVRWLADRPEYHLLGNHLFVNGKALLFACAFFSLDEKSNIYRKGLNILNEELDEQFLKDGAHFELSPMYHSLAMEDLLDLYQLTSFLSKRGLPNKILGKFFAGMNWLSLMTYENNELSNFNDNANGIAPTYKELDGLSKKIGIKNKLKSTSTLNHLSESGFIVYKDENIHLISDVGLIGPDYLPGHAHADSLSFEFYLKEHRIVVNSGTSEYGISKERLRQRSTSAHSTVEVEGQSSSEVWSGFRVARRARVKELKMICNNESLEFGACHNGYSRLLNKPEHRRTWNLSNGKLQIIDNVSGLHNQIIVRYYIHPDINVEKINNDIFFSTGSTDLAKMTSDQSVQILSTTYHDKFGRSRNNKCLLINGVTPFFNKVSISWST